MLLHSYLEVRFSVSHHSTTSCLAVRPVAVDAALEERHGQRRHAQVAPRVDVLGGNSIHLEFWE